jgi:hypothetical protein
MRIRKVLRTTTSEAHCRGFIHFLVGLKIVCISFCQLLLPPPCYLLSALMVHFYLYLYSTSTFTDYLQSASFLQLGSFDRDSQCSVL